LVAAAKAPVHVHAVDESTIVLRSAVGALEVEGTGRASKLARRAEQLFELGERDLHEPVGAGDLEARAPTLGPGEARQVDVLDRRVELDTGGHLVSLSPRNLGGVT
jgi:hypothetical protein